MTAAAAAFKHMFESDVVARWQADRAKYDANPIKYAKQNPYRNPKLGELLFLGCILATHAHLDVSISKVRADLAKEEEEYSGVRLHDMTPSEFIRRGLDLEDRM